MTVGATFETYLTKSRNEIYTACEELDFTWSKKEVNRFDQAWKSGIPIDMIADSLGRDTTEVFILGIDRALSGFIRYRPNGLWGHPPTEEPRKRGVFTKEQRAAVERMLKLGVRVGDIAIVADVSGTAVSKIKKSMRSSDK